jgi:methyltransferase (TIGR00027 family)
MTAAAARAAHLLVDSGPVIFADTLAARLLGDQAEEYIGFHRAHGDHLVLSCARAQATCRSRYTEDSLARAIRQGVTQYVILGAGLDSYAYRHAAALRMVADRRDQAADVTIFEVDHPATQEWKRGVLAAAAIPVPPDLAFVPVDFEHDVLADCLAASGLDLARPAFVSWLGVVMYLTEAAIARTLAQISRLAAGTQLVADYMLPAELRDAVGNSYAEQVMPVAAERGEPWLTFLAPDDMAALAGSHGFGQLAHVAQQDVGGAVMWRRSDSLRPVRLSLIAHATLSR